MKAVLDTNIYVSAFMFPGGHPSRLIDNAEWRKYQLCYSPEILEELRKVLGQKFALTLDRKDRLLRYVQHIGKIVYPEKRLKLVKTDESDNRILECALEAEADFLVTGDKKHLLSLKRKFPFRIVPPFTFYQVLLSLDDPSK